jgi:GNAT superfamily N-acetyltransferase
MVLELRDWRDNDVDWWVGLRYSWYPVMGHDHLRRMASGTVRPWLHRSVAIERGRRLGFAGVMSSPGDSPDSTLVLVEPSARGCGVGHALVSGVLEGYGANPLAVVMPDHDATALAVAQHWGFELRSHSIEAALDLTAGVPVPTPRPDLRVRVIADEDLEAEGLDVDPLLLASSTHPEATELGWIMLRQDFAAMFPHLLWVVAEVCDVPAAVTCADPQDGEDWCVCYTGVDPAFRGRGLARVVKEHLHHYAAARGAARLLTDNEERNGPIRLLNEEMGFIAGSGEYRLIRPGCIPRG